MVMYHDRNLIINYIPRNISDLDLSNLFSTVGTIKTCRIIRDRNNGSSFGFGFCEYEDAKSAHEAIARFNGYRIADKVLKVSLAKLQGRLYQSSNLYVKNFPLTVTEEQLSSEFERFGKVIQCRILRDRDSDVSKGSAYVLFDNRSDAEAAKKALDGAPWPGCSGGLALAIKFATPPYRQPSNNINSGKQNQPRKTNSSPNCFPALNYGDQLSSQLLALQSRSGFPCESMLNGSAQPYIRDPLFLPQGNGMLGTVPPSTVNVQGQPNPCGVIWPSDYVVADGRSAIAAPMQMASAYAPPYYISQYPWMVNQWSSLPSTITPGIASAYPGILEGFTNAVHGCPVFSGLSPSLFTNQTVLNGVQSPSRNVQTEAVPKRSKLPKADKASTSVYVYNIGNLMTNKELSELFGRFGAISCVSIPRDPKTNFARNFGFVTFENFKSAADAVAIMNGFSYAGRRLQVSFRKPRPTNNKTTCASSSKLVEYVSEGGNKCTYEPVTEEGEKTEGEKNTKELSSDAPITDLARSLEDLNLVPSSSKQEASET